MTYVRGHPRDVGWVVGHHRRPHRPGGEQLPLLVALAEVRVPAPRRSPETGRPTARPKTPNGTSGR